MEHFSGAIRMGEGRPSLRDLRDVVFSIFTELDG